MQCSKHKGRPRSLGATAAIDSTDQREDQECDGGISSQGSAAWRHGRPPHGRSNPGSRPCSGSSVTDRPTCPRAVSALFSKASAKPVLSRAKTSQSNIEASMADSMEDWPPPAAITTFADGDPAENGWVSDAPPVEAIEI